MRPFLIITIAILLSSGCTTSPQIQTMQEQSVGKIPCPSERIEIIQYKIKKHKYSVRSCFLNLYKISNLFPDML